MAVSSRTPEAVLRALTELPGLPAGAAPPDMTRAACGSVTGQSLLDRATDGRSRAANMYRGQFVKLCLTECQMYARCLAWVTRAEKPSPGAWGKIYAGLTVNDRRRLAAARDVQAGKQNGQGWDETDKQERSAARERQFLNAPRPPA